MQGLAVKVKAEGNQQRAFGVALAQPWLGSLLLNRRLMSFYGVSGGNGLCLVNFTNRWICSYFQACGSATWTQQ